MTTEESERVRLAIAELCGKCTHPREFVKSTTIEDGNSSDTDWHCYKCGGDPIRDRLPDYLRSLDAMHEAENTLSGAEQFAYSARLKQACGNDFWKHLHATAEQRARAFLKVKSNPSQPIETMNSQPPRNQDSEALERAARRAQVELPDGSAFLLLSTQFGDGGNLRYISNMRREDAINVLKEFLIKCGAKEDWMKHIK